MWLSSFWLTRSSRSDVPEYVPARRNIPEGEIVKQLRFSSRKICEMHSPDFTSHVLSDKSVEEVTSRLLFGENSQLVTSILCPCPKKKNKKPLLDKHNFIS